MYLNNKHPNRTQKITVSKQIKWDKYRMQTWERETKNKQNKYKTNNTVNLQDQCQWSRHPT